MSRIFKEIILDYLDEACQTASDRSMGVPKDYDQEKWVKLYKMAILGLERAKLTGWIEDARIEIEARIVKLRDVPGLHAAEINAIDNAHRILRLLEAEEARHAEDEKRSAIEEVLHQLHSIAPKIEKLKQKRG